MPGARRHHRAATTIGTPWTTSGFNSTFIKAVARLQKRGLVGGGLTFHGLRHTVGTLLIEAGADIDAVRRQKTLAMAIHYSETADASAKMQGIMKARWKHCAVRPREFIEVGVACGIADGRQEHVDEGGDAGRHSLVAFASATASASEFGANPRPTGPPGRAKRAK